MRSEVIDLAPALTRGLATEPLVAAAGAAIATRLGAEAALLTHGFAGAVLVAVLALRPEGRPIVHLAAHDIEIAGPLRDLLRLAGAAPRSIGSVDRATLEAVEAALGPATAAAVWVADDGLRTAPRVDLPAFRWAAHTRRIPTLVLVPGPADLAALVDAGADLVVADATTALAGPPLGIVAGRADLVASAGRAQHSGLGRLVRPAPDHLAALLGPAADERETAVQERRSRLAERLAGRPGLRLLPAAGGCVLHLDPSTATTTARDLAHALAGGRPALVVDDREAAAGRLGLDLARLDAAAFTVVLETLASTLEQPIPPAPWP